MYVTQFHNKYDGLIGNDILIPLKANIDFEKSELKLKNAKLKLHFLSNTKKTTTHDTQKTQAN